MTTQTTRGYLANYLQPNEPNDLRVTRPSRYGNPFHVGKPHPVHGGAMTVDDVCELYEERAIPLLDLEPLRGKRLLCTCKPNQRCHVDSIIKALEGETV